MNMITDYKIFEGINKFNNHKNLIINTVDIINKDYYLDIFKVSWYEYRNFINIRNSINNQIIFEIKIDDYVSIFYNHTKIYYSVSIYDIRKFIINKLSLYNIFNLHDIVDYMMYTNLTYNEFIKKYGLYENKYFVKYLVKKYYPKDIIEEYQYLLDANNFDLI